MYQFIRALRFKDTMAFKDQFRSVDVLMIDDVQFIGEKTLPKKNFFTRLTLWLIKIDRL